jgi:hypothetical protein
MHLQLRERLALAKEKEREMEEKKRDEILEAKQVSFVLQIYACHYCCMLQVCS